MQQLTFWFLLAGQEAAVLTCDWLKQPLHAEMNNLVGFYLIQLGLLETIFAVVIVL